MTIDFSPPPSFSIPTEHLHISYFQPGNPEHTAFTLHLWSIDEITKYIGKRGIDSLETADAFIRNEVQADYNRTGYGRFLVSLKPHPQASLAESKLIGVVSLILRDPPHGYPCPDIGYSFVPQEWGKGYAPEAAIALIDYARREFGVKGVFGFCDPDNKPSRRVLEKIGLEFKGEKNLQAFEGKRNAVYALPEMGSDLSVYGIED
ncbi:hypothetical protein TMatcc_002970 [Talaromyces marneffei ATCC 18224]|uniref:N-acetyltransferase, GNAT family, putative n=2 Tax=Talaromyces marneffei TaxID=37727 RepID=B6Q6S4_TALMQ|nr:uncharacterized protein EYB26_001954 [Talaromyces marneffei]EEA28679.1 N-acetyltransferase, GNAT family, putative [Talaromyces marneffei ATCC 18224]KAE8555703.1 hypothetical protein EYB25_000401 [Talaromyces marneffei]QGA14301.1 hypothetical protein EYB26_001954 [Talaromyces marneffei]